jgi:cation diffusion facilitator CzcD-associated flavoprotein CzcO
VHDDLSRLFAEGFATGLVDANSPAMQAIQAACLQNLEESVRDPELKERLRPDYQAACKRLVISPDFYEAIQLPNAELVTSGIERIEPKGVRTQDGRLHELDVLVLATGFQVDRFMRPIEVVGRDGVRLDDFWEKRPLAYLSISIPDFPNLFMLNGPNGPVGNFSLIEIAEIQFSYIMRLVELYREGRARGISASHEATIALEEERVEAARSTIWMSGCRSWYLDDRGVPATWPWTFDRFREEMSEPKLESYELV